MARFSEQELQVLERLAREQAKRHDTADAFMRENPNGPQHAPDDLAEELAEEFLLSATRAEETHANIDDDDLPEDLGGPFIETSADTELASGIDETNPIDAEPAELPTVGPWNALHIAQLKNRQN
jgi:hypothetical protein